MNIQLLKKYSKPGPRYTSYPPATFFHENFTVNDYRDLITDSNEHSPDNVSLYFHIPFCLRLCHFCGCNTSIFRDKAFVSRYIDAIITEMENVAKLLNKERIITQIHWGGGTPNAIALEFIEKIMNKVATLFRLSPDAEVAMECNPAYLSFSDIERLHKLGFNRLSIGIQDFDEKILKLVNREPSKIQVEDLISKIRETGIAGVNMDFIYGLPAQTVESFGASIERAAKILPDRLVTFSYAHVPWVKRAQKQLEAMGLPSTEEKIRMFERAFDTLTRAGYVSIGMDHYARWDDGLAKAHTDKMLHRNFQGYCSKETTGQVYGFGSTAISQLSHAYLQNEKDASVYVEKIERDGVAFARGYKLTKNETVCRYVINEIMCNGLLDFDDVASRFGMSTGDVKMITNYDETKLDVFREDDLLTIDGNKICLKTDGFLVVRNIAMEFDPLATKSEMQYSKTL